MEDLKEVFKDKNFDEFTLNLIENFLYEFKETFGDLVSKEELIKRISNNLNNSIVISEKMERNTTGNYNASTKTITLLKGLDEEKEKAVFFHEMIHCITSYKDFVGFGIQYYDNDNMGSTEIKTARGITEGFTQLATKRRNQKFGVKFDTYPILTEQVENIAELLGEEVFFDIAFNNPLGLEQAMMDKGIVEYYGEADIFLQNFDTIWQHEKEIYETRDYQKTSEARLLAAIFKFSKEKNFRVEDAKAHIINTFLGVYEKREITTPEELVELFNKTDKYNKQLDLQNSINSYITCFQKFRQLELSGIDREEILAKMPEEIRTIIETHFKFEEFIELPPKEILKQMAENPDELDSEYLTNRFADDYVSRMVRKIFLGISNEKCAVDLAAQLTRGFAKEILEKGYNIEKLGFEFIKIPGITNTAFNMYEADGNETSYIGTFANITTECDLEEYKTCSEEERKRILEENNLQGTEGILVSPNGCIMIYSGDDEYRFIDEDGFSYENHGRINGCYSNIEYLKLQLERQIARYKLAVNNKYPKEVIENNYKLVKKTKDSIESREGKKKFTPQDIEETTLSGEVGIQDIDSILEEFKMEEMDREEVFKKGISYNE